jgi:GT2 family glycosyltransferase
MAISFVTVTYNSGRDILELLESLRAIAQSGDELIVCDNASADSTVAIVKKFRDTPELPFSIELLASAQNRGFGQACNEGAKVAKNSWLVFVNPDCACRQSGLHSWIVQTYSGQTGVLAPLIRFPDGTIQPNQGGTASLLTYVLQFLKVGQILRRLNLVDHICKSTILEKILSKNSSVKGFLSNYKAIPQHKQVDWVSGAFLVLRRDLFTEAGGFDPNFFLYCEDEDLCRRIKSMGYEISFDPAYEVIHKVEGSRAAALFSRGQLERLRSNVYYLLKWNGLMSAIMLNLFYIFAFVLKVAVNIGLWKFQSARGNWGYLLGMISLKSFSYKKGREHS